MSDTRLEEFTRLLKDAQRSDGYMNATMLCKAFGYRLDNWKKLPETKARLAALCRSDNLSEPEVLIVERIGKSWITWIHPIMAVHLYSYLDQAFSSYVDEIFIRYAFSDPNLAADIASRQNSPETLDIINGAVQRRLQS